MKKVFIITTIFLLLSSIFIYGAGGGGGGSSSKAFRPEERSCEDRSSIKDRVQCRLEKKEEGTIHESCRVLERTDDCATLYRRVYSCYEKTGKEKDECFKQKARFTYKTVKKEAGVSSENVRNYLLFLLYDLEERVEEAYDEGKLTSEEAAELISDIVEIKQAILLGKSKSDVKSLLNPFKNKWKEKMR